MKSFFIVMIAAAILCFAGAGFAADNTVTVKSGKTVKGKATEVSPKLNPQPEPPSPVDIKKSAVGKTAVPSTPETPNPPPKQGVNIGK